MNRVNRVYPDHRYHAAAVTPATTPQIAAGRQLDQIKNLSRRAKEARARDRRVVKWIRARVEPVLGIIVRMFAEAGSPHHVAHFHAYYQDEVGIFSIDPVDMIAGSLPARQRRLIEAWGELHQAELRVDWERLQGGHLPAPIEPLR